jgi:tetratricopeptide (TPR) repeat protein
MPFPLFRGWQTALLLLLPLALEAQPGDASATSPLRADDTMFADSTRADTLVAIEMPAFVEEPLPPPPSFEASDSLPRGFAPPLQGYPFGMLVAKPDDTVELEYREETEPPAPVFVDSGLVRALVSSASMHVESQELDMAVSEFDAAVQADPTNLQALNGLGYTSAWTGRYKDAGDAFQKSLAVDSQNFDAAKGLAYVAHWRGRNDEAAARFGALAAEHPGDRELAMMHARTLLADRRLGDARTAYEKVLALDPDNIDARNGLLIARTANPKVELTSWLGVTWFDDEERPRADANLGFRFVEVAIWPTTSSRIWFQYDNGLTLDNVVLSAGNRAVPAGYIGGFTNYGERREHTTRLELGWRSLPGSVGETLFRSEHVLSLQGRWAIKGGLWLGFRSDDRTEFIFHSGLTIPLGDRFELSPTFFYASNGMPNEKEWRALLSGEYRFENGWQLSGGLAGGQASTGYINDYRGISDRYLKVSAPVGRANRAHALFRTEFIGETDATTVLAVGVTIGLSER